jgi:hypothetical protein
MDRTSSQPQVKLSLFCSISLKIPQQGMGNFKKEQGKGRLRHLKWEVGREPGFKL